MRKDIIGPNDGSLEGGTTFAQGKVGQAFRFDGVDGYIRVPNHTIAEPGQCTDH